MKPNKLEFRHVGGAGMQIHAELSEDVECCEFSLKPAFHMIATEPWIQFKPQKWTDMIKAVFTEMVQLWNDRQGKYVITLDLTHVSPMSRLKLVDVIEREISRQESNIAKDIADNGYATDDMAKWSKQLYGLSLNIRDQARSFK
jgi:hypothetical protein